MLTASFARLNVKSVSNSAKVELGLDWRKNKPIGLAVGPVLHADDAVANKVCALVSRGNARDFIDVAEAMRRGWSPEELIALAWRLNSDDYGAEYFTGVLPNLRRLGDFDFTGYGLTDQQVKELRELFDER